jgi:hypothetical protein
LARRRDDHAEVQDQATPSAFQGLTTAVDLPLLPGDAGRTGSAVFGLSFGQPSPETLPALRALSSVLERLVPPNPVRVVSPIFVGLTSDLTDGGFDTQGT